ncbi:CAMK family protein kinase [Tritrichomonas foetus]|uniref:CAMK family protein kinase n=1 Tax=Tritrichomonas foetus TaxID=1144522 RepID=A0A1J4K3T6_9EUKA|nr:CAMK family protein kinase [Tritrichomonas foetus]|eukprot:OHT04141.1 CAMK family protein kinase [Tritrichomonas foetus]
MGACGSTASRKAKIDQANASSKKNNESSRASIAGKRPVAGDSYQFLNDENQNPNEVNDMPPNNLNKTYPTFASFLLQNERAQIYEWQFLNEIGKGAMSRVFLTKNIENGEICAAKVYNKSQLSKQNLGTNETMFDQVNREIDIMAKLSNPYILSLIEAIEDDVTNSLILILPFAINGTLQSLLEKGNSIDDDGLAVCFHQTAEALRYLHSNNIVHRDIKPDNILAFSNTYYVLSDFSVSTELESEDTLLEDTKGSPAFLSPEECSGEKFDGKRADVWAYGITLYSAVYGRLPFNLDSGQSCSIANTVLHVTQMLEQEELEFPESRPISNELKEVLTNVLQKDPKKRPSFEQIVKYEWFKDAWEIDKANQQNPEEEEDEVIETGA